MFNVVGVLLNCGKHLVVFDNKVCHRLKQNRVRLVQAFVLSSQFVDLFVFFCHCSFPSATATNTSSGLAFCMVICLDRQAAVWFGQSVPVVSLSLTSFPQQSQPSAYCLANNSMRGMSPNNSTILSLAPPGFFECSSIGVIMI